jgi:hypothetical protein
MIKVMSVPTKYWFPAKSYGWGWGVPSTWQGWVVLGAFAALLFGTSVLFPPHSAPLAFGACVFVLCAALVGICHAKGEPPRWRSGSK